MLSTKQPPISASCAKNLRALSATGKINVYQPKSFPVKSEDVHFKVKEPQANNLPAGRRIPSVMDSDVDNMRKIRENRQGSIPFEEKKMIDFYKNFKACERVEKEFFDGNDHSTLKQNQKVLENTKYCMRYL